jgi:hypothetical protein
MPNAGITGGWSSVMPVRSRTVRTAQDGPTMFIAPSMIADW